MQGMAGLRVLDANPWDCEIRPPADMLCTTTEEAPKQIAKVA
jgi:hypothetical protein